MIFFSLFVLTVLPESPARNVSRDRDDETPKKRMTKVNKAPEKMLEKGDSNEKHVDREMVGARTSAYRLGSRKIANRRNSSRPTSLWATIQQFIFHSTPANVTAKLALFIKKPKQSLSECDADKWRLMDFDHLQSHIICVRFFFLAKNYRWTILNISKQIHSHLIFFLLKIHS